MTGSQVVITVTGCGDEEGRQGRRGSGDQARVSLHRSTTIIAIAGPGPCPVQVQSESVRESLRISENDKDLDQGIAL